MILTPYPYDPITMATNVPLQTTDARTLDSVPLHANVPYGLSQPYRVLASSVPLHANVPYVRVIRATVPCPRQQCAPACQRAVRTGYQSNPNRPRAY